MNVNCNYSKMVEVHRLTPHPRNANKHPEKQIDMLAKIIDHTGFRHPIIVSKRSGFIVAGHGRLAAAEKLGVASVPVDYQDFKDEAEEFSFLIADNKIAELSEHDDSIMIDGIKDLEIDDYELLGLDSFTLESIETGMPELSDDERSPLRQMAFQLTEEQQADVDRAIVHAKAMGDFGDTGSSNSNGNALQRICQIFCTTEGA